MTDRDSDSGQFTSQEPAFGQEGLLRDAGYVPLQEGGEIEPEQDELTAHEAAEALTEAGTPEGDIKTYTGVAELDSNVALTVEQAAKIVKDDRDADALAAEGAEAEQIRKEVDALRAEKADGEKPEATGVSENPVSEAGPGEIDPEIEKALSNPRIAEAISKQIGEAESSRQHYAAGLEAATTIAQHAFISSFPEFANVPQEQHAAVIAGLQQHNPARFNQLFHAVQSTQGLFQAQAQEQERARRATQAEMQSYAREQGNKFNERMKGEPKDTIPKVQREFESFLSGRGVSTEDFFRAHADNRLLWSAEGQELIVKAMKYDMLMKAPKAVASRAPVPAVQRPGVAGPRGGAALAEDFRSLNQRLTDSGDIKDAVKLLEAKRKARG